MNKLIRFAKAKAYYLVLAAAVITVGAVSFVSYRAAQKDRAEQTIPPDDLSEVEKVEENVPDTRTEPSEPAPETQQTEVDPPKAEYAAPLAGELLQQFSPDQPIYSYTLKDWRTHSGIDLGAPAGTVVSNVSDGVVDSVTTDDLLGHLVVVRHTDGWISRYASLEEVTVQEGQLLALGDPIGTVGRSMLLECGETEHLHYELWEGDSPLDPTAVFK